MSLTAYTYPNNPRVWKSQIAGKYVGAPDIATPDFKFGVDNKTEAFLKKNPLGKVPTLETPEGCIWESNAMARYVARLGSNNIYGSNNYEAALVDQWIDFATGEIDLPAAAWLYPIMGIVPNNSVATGKAQGDIRKALGILNTHLQTRTFLVGERISLADIIVAMSLIRLYEMVLEPGFKKQFVNTNRWFNTLINQPNFKSVIGEVKFCEKMQKAPDAPTQAAPAAAAPKKEEKKAEKPAPAKKEEKKKEAKAEEEEEDDTPKEAKRDNPLDKLPPSKFVMDEWKRTYSNKDTRTEAIPWFWENLDTEGFSLWFAHYKYQNELEKVFMTCNLVGGFLQRLDSLRKYGFGTVIVFGNDTDGQEIHGFFLVRGKELPFEVTDCPDYESYTFEPADHTKPEIKKLIENFLAWDGDFAPVTTKAVNQGKTFK